MKTCPKCKYTKQLTEFSKNRKRSDGRQSWCKECSGKLHRDSYHTGKRKSQVLNRNKRNRVELREHVRRYKIAQGCVICGYHKCADALDLHHNTKNKEATISMLVNSSCSLEKLEREIDKCSVLCSNCHRELHSTQ